MRPVPRGGAAPRIQARYKEAPDDFEVEELPAYEPSGQGTHCWLWIRKRGIATLDAVRLLARALSRRDKEFGYAGLKDAQAVARQWISVEHVDADGLERLRSFAHEDLEVLDIRQHDNKLKVGHLRGNRFRILLRGADLPAQASADVLWNLHRMAREGVPNYFGEQRFGKRGGNLDKGLRILQQGNPRKAAHTMPRRLFSLLISAVQSEVFNRVLAARLETMDRLLAGDVAWIHRNGACFLVGDPRAEQPRCDRFEISPTGPLPGPEMLAPAGDAAELEADALAQLQLDPAVFGRMPHKTHMGTRRPLRVPVTQPSVERVDLGLWVSFQLPPGAYATSVLRELLVQSPWFASESRGR